METSQKEIVEESVLGEWVRTKVLPIFTKTPKLSIIQGSTLFVMSFLLSKTMSFGNHLIWDLLYLMLIVLDGVETTYFIGKKMRNCYPVIFVGWVSTVVLFSIYLFHH